MPKVAAGRDVAHAGKTKGEFAAGKGALLAPSTVMSGRKKTKFCMYHLQGVCRYSSTTCAFAHSMEEMDEARRAKKGQSRGVKTMPFANFCDEFSSASTVGNSSSGSMAKSVDYSVDRLHAYPHLSGQQCCSASTHEWSELEEPMFVETSSPSSMDSLPSYSADFAMPHDPEQYLVDGFQAARPARIRTQLTKPGQDLGASFSVALAKLHALAREQEVDVGLGFDGRYTGIASEVGFSPRAAEFASALYAMPNPFIGLARTNGTSPPACGSHVSLGLSCALGA
mmetsp:Transcript_82531/g.207681  ORF Transcript_82531/g.207681 Transcript_82531/m.207681 type:complete len:283 (-) Transcript_82531:365-1213(-)